MNRLLFLLVAASFGSIGVVVAQLPSETRLGSGNDDNKLTIPPLIKIGDTGDRVRELQATLNENLRGKTIKLPAGTVVGDLHEKSVADQRGVREFRLPDGPDLRIRADWRGGWVSKDWETEGDSGGWDKEEKKGEGDFPALQLPRKPLKVDGVYGQHTYSGVLLFQLQLHLQPTGAVDAVTLDKLEPMIPSNRLLAMIMTWLAEYLDLNKTHDHYALWIKRSTAIVTTLLILLASMVVYQVARSLTNSTRFLSRWLFTPTTSPWFTTLREKKVFIWMAHFVPALFIYCAAWVIFPEPSSEKASLFPYLNVFQQSHTIVCRFGLAYAAFVCMWVSWAFVDTCCDIYTAGQPEDNPIEGIVRSAKRLIGLVGMVLIWAALVGKNPALFVGGLGAFMALIMLVFKDAILGLVASVQIVSNKMIKIGDWIEVPKYGANGDVLEVSLSCVKVQNFDKTISTIPTYSLLSESFRNWSGMRQAGGRRIKRAILIDMHSIGVCTPEMVERFEKIELIRDYIREKKSEIEQYNADHNVDGSPINSRRITNIGTFRVYIDTYLASHPKLSDEMTRLVRHLQPAKTGLPIEIYAFCTDTAWPEYEAVQAGIFDHLLSILPEFGLRAFQDVTDRDACLSAEAEPSSQESLPHRMTDVDKQAAVDELKGCVEQQNRYLTTHPNARVDVAIGKVEKKIKNLGIAMEMTVVSSDRTLSLQRVGAD